MTAPANLETRRDIFIAALFTASTSFAAMVKLAIDVSLVGAEETMELAAFLFVFPVVAFVISAGRGIYIATAKEFASSEHMNEGVFSRTAVLDAVKLSIFIGGVLAVALFVALPEISRALNADEYQERLTAYFKVWLWTVPLVFVSSNTYALLRNLGLIKTASAITIASTAVGLAVSLWLIPKRAGAEIYGIQGSAISMLVTNILSTAVSLGIVLARSRRMSERTGTLSLIARRMWLTALPVLVANLIPPVLLTSLTRAFASYGQDAAAAYAVVGRLEQILLMLQTAVTTVAIPILAPRLAALELHDLKRDIIKIVQVMVGSGIALALLTLVSRSSLSSAGTISPGAQLMSELLMTYIPWIVICHGLFLLTTTVMNLLSQAKRALYWYCAHYGGLSVVVALLPVGLVSLEQLVVIVTVWYFALSAISWRSLRVHTWGSPAMSQ